MPSPTEITVSQLARLIGTPDVPTLIDVSVDEAFDDDPRFIPSAKRFAFADIEQIAAELRGHRVVIYCHKGLKLSQGAAAILRDCGINAETLKGGFCAWRDAGQPLVPA